jgi:hypothetical protein
MTFGALGLTCNMTVVNWLRKIDRQSQRYFVNCKFNKEILFNPGFALKISVMPAAGVNNIFFQSNSINLKELHAVDKAIHNDGNKSATK